MHQKRSKVRVRLSLHMDEIENPPDGQFGAMMSVALTNEGPVTFTLESRTPSSLPTATLSTFNTRSNTPSAEAERKKAEKALRKAEWEKKKATKTGLEEPA
jgi:D-tyrosyl-tRNA(Tyr) deacylase